MRAFYAAIAEDQAARFAAEAERAVHLIGEHPGARTSIGRSLRRIVVRHFPYMLVYREGAEVQRVIAVAHTRRGWPQFPWPVSLDFASAFRRPYLSSGKRIVKVDMEKPPGTAQGTAP